MLEDPTGHRVVGYFGLAVGYLVLLIGGIVLVEFPQRARLVWRPPWRVASNSPANFLSSGFPSDKCWREVRPDRQVLQREPHDLAVGARARAYMFANPARTRARISAKCAGRWETVHGVLPRPAPPGHVGVLPTWFIPHLGILHHQLHRELVLGLSLGPPPQSLGPYCGFISLAACTPVAVKASNILI